MKPEDNLESPLVASRKRTMELLDITDYRILRKLVQEGKLDEVQIGDRSKITMQSILLLAGYGSRLQSHEKQKNSQTLPQKHPSDFNSTILSRYSHGGAT